MLCSRMDGKTDRFHGRHVARNISRRVATMDRQEGQVAMGSGSTSIGEQIRIPDTVVGVIEPQTFGFNHEAHSYGERG